MRGVTLKELQELFGHSSLAVTMRYAHVAPEHLRTAVGRLEGLTSTEPAKVSSASFSARACRDRGGAAEVAEVVGSPGWARTSDFLIKRRLAAGPPSFCIVLSKHAPPLDFFYLASRTLQDSRRARGLKSACRMGAFSASQRKQADLSAR
jgi:hypothetical protein